MSDVVTDVVEVKSEENDIHSKVTGSGHLLALTNRDIGALFEEYSKITIPHDILSIYGLGNKHYMILEIKGFIKKKRSK